MNKFFDKIKKKSENINVDKTLKTLCKALFALVLISQIGLKIPFVKGVFSDIEVFEGTAVGDDAVQEGVVTLTLLVGRAEKRA